MLPLTRENLRSADPLNYKTRRNNDIPPLAFSRVVLLDLGMPDEPKGIPFGDLFRVIKSRQPDEMSGLDK